MPRTKKLTVAAMAAALLMAGGMSSAMADHTPGHAGKITICHRTGSDKNPYVKITISENARHAHIGDEAHPPKDGRVDFEIAPGGNCSTPPPPPPPPPPVHDGDDCDALSDSGNSTQSQHGLVNVGNINLGGNNLLANAFCQADVLNGLAVSLVGPALGGDSLGSGLLTGSPLGLLSGAPGYLLSGLTTDVRVLANVLVIL